MSKPRFSIKESISYGWGVANKELWFFFKLLLVLFAIQLILDGLMAAVPFGGLIIAVVVRVIVAMGMISIVLKLIDKKKPRIQDLWSVYKPFWTYLGAVLLVGLGVFVGSILLLVPGIMLALGWMFFSYLLIDKNLGVMDSIKRSWEITYGEKWRLLGFGILLGFINFLGALLLGIGIFWTIPTTIMAMAYTYRKLEGSAKVATAKKK